MPMGAYISRGAINANAGSTEKAPLLGDFVIEQIIQELLAKKQISPLQINTLQGAVVEAPIPMSELHQRLLLGNDKLLK